MAAENRGYAGGADRERCHRRCAGGVHNNVRKKIARGYQNGHERCVRRRNLRYSRRPLQYLQRLRHYAGGISSNIVDHPHPFRTNLSSPLLHRCCSLKKKKKKNLFLNYCFRELGGFSKERIYEKSV